MWAKERTDIGWIHWLDIEQPDETKDYYVKVEKSAAGDYFGCVFLEGDDGGGELEFFDTLAQAKNWAERLVSSGNWLHNHNRQWPD
jgi:hypothetical protein